MLNAILFLIFAHRQNRQLCLTFDFRQNNFQTEFHLYIKNWNVIKAMFKLNYRDFKI